MDSKSPFPSFGQAVPCPPTSLHQGELQTHVRREGGSSFGLRLELLGWWQQRFPEVVLPLERAELRPDPAFGASTAPSLTQQLCCEEEPWMSFHPTPSRWGHLQEPQMHRSFATSTLLSLIYFSFPVQCPQPQQRERAEGELCSSSCSSSCRNLFQNSLLCRAWRCGASAPWM